MTRTPSSTHGQRAPRSVPASRRRAARACLALLATLLGAHAVRAEEGAGLGGAPLLPAYRQECGACHVAYPPQMLPAASWQRLLATLPRHFGTDASLDPATTQSLSAWLQGPATGSRRAGASPPQDRITRSPWFLREHDEVPAGAWTRAAVKSAAQCGACHTRADQGDYSERNIRIPR